MVPSCAPTSAAAQAGHVQWACSPCAALPSVQVYRPTGLRLAAIRAVGLIMLLAAAGATVGAVYTMVHSFQTVEFFQ